MKMRLRDTHLIFINTNTIYEVAKALSFETYDNDAVDMGLNICSPQRGGQKKYISTTGIFRSFVGDTVPSRQDLEAIQAKPRASLLLIQWR